MSIDFRKIFINPIVLVLFKTIQSMKFFRKIKAKENFKEKLTF